MLTFADTPMAWATYCDSRDRTSATWLDAVRFAAVPLHPLRYMGIRTVGAVFHPLVHQPTRNGFRRPHYLHYRPNWKYPE